MEIINTQEIPIQIHTVKGLDFNNRVLMDFLAKHGVTGIRASSTNTVTDNAKDQLISGNVGSLNTPQIQKDADHFRKAQVSPVSLSEETEETDASQAILRTMETQFLEDDVIFSGDDARNPTSKGNGEITQPINGAATSSGLQTTSSIQPTTSTEQNREAKRSSEDTARDPARKRVKALHYCGHCDKPLFYSVCCGMAILDNTLVCARCNSSIRFCPACGTDLLN